LPDQCLLTSTVVLPGGGGGGGRHQGRVDDLTATRDETFLEQLRRDAVEQRLRPGFTNPVREGPYGGAIRDVSRVRQSTEALVAQAVEQLILHLLIGQVVQTLQHQDPQHRLGRVRRTTALSTHHARRHSINLGRQRRKVNVRFDVHQRVTQRIDLFTMMFVSEQVGLDGATGFHHGKLKKGSEQLDFTKGERAKVFRGPHTCLHSFDRVCLENDTEHRLTERNQWPG